MLKVKLKKNIAEKLRNKEYKLTGKKLTIAYVVKGVTLQAVGLCLKHRKRKTKYETIKLRVSYRKTYYDILLNIKHTKSFNYIVNT